MSLYKNGNKNSSRREFIKTSANALGICICGLGAITVLNSCENFIEKTDPSRGTVIEIDINKDEFKNLSKLGFGLMITFPKVNYGIPIIIVKIADDKYACYSSMCTHAHCFGKDVRPPFGTTPGFRDIVCSCHGSRFDPFDNAKVIEGPAEKPLKQYPTEFNPDTKLLKITF